MKGCSMNTEKNSKTLKKLRAQYTLWRQKEKMERGPESLLSVEVSHCVFLTVLTYRPSLL